MIRKSTLKIDVTRERDKVESAVTSKSMKIKHRHALLTVNKKN